MDVGDLLFVLIVLWSILGAAFGSKKKGERVPPRPQRPQDRERAPAPGPQPTARGPDYQADESAAADMLPDELWEVLTGQRRAPRPEPEPEAEWEQPADEEAALEATSSWYEGANRPIPGQPVSLETYEPHEPPRVVSLETPLQSPERRHTAFHTRLEGLDPAATVGGRVRRPLGTRAELRRAIVLREILGPPKALE